MAEIDIERERYRLLIRIPRNEKKYLRVWPPRLSVQKADNVL